MKNNIVDQLHEALDILKDYPGVNDILDVENAQLFLKQLSTSKFQMIPSFKEVDSDIVSEFLNDSTTSLEEWENALNDLTGVCVLDYDEEDPDELIWGAVEPDLAALHSNRETNRELFYAFKSGNKAKFNGQEGTWKEIFLQITKHVKENLCVPDLPQTEE